MAGIRITLVEDVSSVVRGSQDVGRAFDRNADSLDDLAREAQRAGRTTGEALSDGAERGEDAVQRLERTFREMSRDVGRQARTVGDDLDDGVTRGADDATDAVGEFRDEARANFSEVASSFTGDMSSAAEGVQGILGGLAGSLPGPLGLISGLLAAVGGGFLQNWISSTETVKETTQEMYDDLLESGADYLSKDWQQKVYYDILQGNSKDLKLRELEQIATFSQQSQETVALAYAGNVEAMKLVTDGLIEKRRVFEEQLKDETTTNDSAAKSYLRESDRILNGLEARRAKIDETIATVQRQRSAFEQMGTAAIESADEARAAYDGLGRRISELPDTKVVRAVVDTSEAERQIRRFTDGSYTVRVNGRIAGMRYE